MAKKGVSRITGNTSPKTGEKALYKVTEWYPGTPANERKESLVTWELFRKRPDGKFTSTNIKKKVGEFTFGKDAWQYTYRVEGYLDKPEGKDPMSIIVQPQKNEQQPSAEKKILDVKLTFQDGTPVNKKLSYQDRLWAIAKCQGMEGEHIIFTLWEDDERGDGHNKKNQSIVKSPPVLVDSQGNARWNFALLSTYIAIANQREDDKKQHEYYVTAEYNGKLKASDNANANNPEYKAPPAPPKKPAGGTGGTSQPKPAPPKPQPNSPKGSTRPNSPNNQPDKKGEITLVKLTDKNGKEFSKNPKFGETIIVHIESKNLKGKKYTLKIWEHDTIGKDDLLYSHEHTFLGDKINLSMPLTAAMQKSGEIGNDPKNPDSGEYWKGGQQEIFAEVIYIDISSKSKIIDVGIMETPKPQNNGNTATGVKNEPKTNKPGEKCFCNRDFEEKDVRRLVKLLKGSETIWEGQALKGGKRASCNISDKSFASLTKELNSALKKYKVNTCAQKMHFLAQVCEETGTFSLSEETKSNHLSSVSFYKGRGILQLTGVKKKGEDKYDAPGPYKDYADYKGDQSIIKKPETVANNIHYCIDSGAWLWSINKKMTSNPKSDAITKWGKETLGKSLNELAVYVDKYLELISVLLNGRNASTGMPNGWQIRQNNYNLLKTGFFMYEKFHGNNKTPIVGAKGIVTYHIYAEGKIEKHIPKTIKSGYEKQYRYVYHENNKEHEICTVEWHITKKKNNGVRFNTIPNHSKVLKDENVNEGQTKRRVKYENGDIAEYGSNKGKKFWNLYTAINSNIELVKMPDSLTETSLGIIYKFSNTKRRYTAPGALAGFIGALADCKFNDILTTGSCFYEGTCFPSVAHVNGKSIDTLYIERKKEEKFVKAMSKFYFDGQITGSDGTHSYPGTTHKSDHNDHLHSGFNESKIKIINE
ncbi:hypothetical protein [Chryseobacterium timonianum]|uniref:hypothetical protein n=2 Tax=Chryseobacterium TaxID=59732 RepID=UPI00083AE8A1|nr:hypothetical protein [Chryseobacterium timonianum]